MCKVIEQTEDIKYNMREGWTNLITIERLIAESPFAKMPLISYGSKGQVSIGNSENSDSDTLLLPSCMELMEIVTRFIKNLGKTHFCQKNLPIGMKSQDHYGLNCYVMFGKLQGFSKRAFWLLFRIQI